MFFGKLSLSGFEKKCSYKTRVYQQIRASIKYHSIAVEFKVFQVF